ncbi:hypothetical protein GCM10023238_38530 [Streptomyces heliomycini]
MLREAPARAAAVHHTVVLAAHSGAVRPGRSGWQRDPARVLLGFVRAERVDVELVPVEPAHQAVAPEPALTAHIRITTLRKQSDAHVCTPDLPRGEPPLVRRLTAGRTYADKEVA